MLSAIIVSRTSLYVTSNQRGFRNRGPLGASHRTSGHDLRLTKWRYPLHEQATGSQDDPTLSVTNIASENHSTAHLSMSVALPVSQAHKIKRVSIPTKTSDAHIVGSSISPASPPSEIRIGGKAHSHIVCRSSDECANVSCTDVRQCSCTSVAAEMQIATAKCVGNRTSNTSATVALPAAAPSLLGTRSVGSKTKAFHTPLSSRLSEKDCVHAINVR